MASVVAFDGLELTYTFFSEKESACPYIKKFFLIMMRIAKDFFCMFY